MSGHRTDTSAGLAVWTASGAVWVVVVGWLPLRSLAGSAPGVWPLLMLCREGFVLDREPADSAGVELFVLDDAAVSVPPRSPGDGECADDPDYAPAEGRHRGPGWGQKVVVFGRDSTQTAGRVVGEQIATVLQLALVGMDEAGLPTSGAGLVTSSVQVSFGLKLTAGAGKVIEAVMSAGGEVSVQVVVTLARPVPYG
jgi:hypothetical protein